VGRPIDVRVLVRDRTGHDLGVGFWHHDLGVGHRQESRLLVGLVGLV
jgi:hypothetical protein